MQLDLKCYHCKKQYWSYGWYLKHIKKCQHISNLADKHKKMLKAIGEL